ncbi:MAG: ABC transporter permease [Bacteroidales bacterium]
MSFWKNTKAVFQRELRQMFARPIYVFAPIIVMAFTFVFFLTFFQEGVPQELPIGVVDHDHSTMSRRVVREFNAIQAVHVNKNYSSYSEARQDLQDGKIYGFVEIPTDWYANVGGNKRPELTIYVNNAYLLGGTLSYRGMLTLGNLASGAYERIVLRMKGVQEDQLMGLLQPIIIDAHQIGNVYTNYGIYLLNLLIPGVLQLLILLTTAFAIGYELKSKSSKKWLETANGSMIAAMVGKLLPYSFLFVILGIGSNVILYDFCGYPINGHEYNMMLNMILFVFSSQCMGIFAIGLFPILRESIFFCSFYGILAFSLAGFTFPVEYMHPVWSGLANLFPLRHFFLFYSKEAVFATGFAGWWPQVIGMLAFGFFPIAIYKRLENALIKQNYPLK